MSNSVVQKAELGAEDVASGQPLIFAPCSGTELQEWTLDETGSLFVAATTYQCVDIDAWGAGPRLNTYSCAHSANQLWERRVVPQCTAADVGTLGISCSQLVNPTSGMCLTKVTTSGAAIGLDAGTTMAVAQARPCITPASPSQTFDLVHGDQQGFPNNFPIRSAASVEGGSDSELCLQPYVTSEPEFDAVAFLTPQGTVSVVAMNAGDKAQTFTLFESTSGLGAAEVTVPPHSINSYTLPRPTKPIDIVAAADRTESQPGPIPGVSFADELVAAEPRSKLAPISPSEPFPVPERTGSSSPMMAVGVLCVVASAALVLLATQRGALGALASAAPRTTGAITGFVGLLYRKGSGTPDDADSMELEQPYVLASPQDD